MVDISVPIIGAGFMCHTIAVAKKDYTVLQRMQSDPKYKFQEFPIFDSPSSIYCEIFEKVLRPYIPVAFT